MGTIQYVGKWGNSLAVRIPKAIAKQCNIVEGASVQLEASNEGIMIRNHPCDLANMVDQITSDNMHHEEDFGAPVGKEIW